MEQLKGYLIGLADSRVDKIDKFGYCLQMRKRIN